MRRMNSKDGIIDIVNEAIDEGQIEVGGGLPEIEVGDAGKVLMVNEGEDGVEWGEAGGGNNVLVLPKVAPAAQQLVGINTSNEQNALGIGEGLVVEDGQIKGKIIIIDWENSTSTRKSADFTALISKLNNGNYTFFLVKNIGNTSFRPYGGKIFGRVTSSKTSFKENLSIEIASSTSIVQAGPYLKTESATIIVYNDRIDISIKSSKTEKENVVFLVAGGTLTNSQFSNVMKNGYTGGYYLADQSDIYTICPLIAKTCNYSTSGYIVFTGEKYDSTGVLSASYKVVLDTTTKIYTVTSL